MLSISPSQSSSKSLQVSLLGSVCPLHGPHLPAIQYCSPLSQVVVSSSIASSGPVQQANGSMSSSTFPLQSLSNPSQNSLASGFTPPCLSLQSPLQEVKPSKSRSKFSSTSPSQSLSISSHTSSDGATNPTHTSLPSSSHSNLPN